MKKILETGTVLLAVMGFWGMIYPDLCFVEDVCMVYMMEEECADALPADVFTGLCMAKPEQIQVKSRLMEVIMERKTDSNVGDKR